MYQKPDFLYDENGEDSTFVKEIERDSNICNSCYRKVREHIPTRNDVATAITEYEEHADFEYFDDFKESGRPNRHKAYCTCGAVDWQDVRVRPIDFEKMMNIAERISLNLFDKGVQHDPETLKKYVEKNFNRPEYQNREELLLEHAVEEAT